MDGAMSAVFEIALTDTKRAALPLLPEEVAYLDRTDWNGSLVLKVLWNYTRTEGVADEITPQSQTPALQRRFGSEYEIPLTLPRHPGVVHILHAYYGNTDDFREYVHFHPFRVPEGIPVGWASRTAFVVMPYYSKSLRKYISDRPAGLTSSEWYSIVLSLLHTLTFLSQHHVAHRDLKPENIFIGAHGRPVLADFGSARFTAEPPAAGSSQWRDIPFVDAGQALVFTPATADPQVQRLHRAAQHGRPVDAAGGRLSMTLAEVYATSDLYSLGRSVYMLVLPGGFPTRDYYRLDEVRSSRDILIATTEQCQFGRQYL